jgi:hypothetical protein
VFIEYIKMTTSQQEASQVGAFSSMLAFKDHKKRSAGGSIERVILPAVNGNSFRCGQSIDLVIPGSTEGYMDTHNSYLRFKINYDRKTNTAGHRLRLPTNGVYCLFKRVELIASGVTISSIDEYSKLCNLVLDMDMTENHRVGSGAVQYGMGASTTQYENAGQDISGGSTGAVALYSAEFCFSPVMTALFSATKYLPLMGDQLRLRFTLNDFDNAFISGERAGTDVAWAGDSNNVTISPVELIMYKIHLDDLPQALVQQNTGNVFSLVLNDFTNSKGTVATGDTSSVFNTGFSYTSLSRILFAFFPSITAAADRGLVDLERHKVTRSVSQYCFNVSGKNIPAQKLKGTAGGAEVLQENKASLHLLGDFQHNSSVDANSFNINNHDGTAALKDGETYGSIGSRHYEIDLETLKQYSDENGYYSGISTISKNTSVQVEYSAAGSQQCEVNMWAEHQIGLTLDMNGSRTWSVIV